jgi:hypothetical protein
MEKEEAIRLFFREARRSFPKWGEHLSPEEWGSLAEIAAFMQGHPLAIKLVAGQSTKRKLAGIRDELRRNPPKKVSDKFDVSYNCLEDGQKDLFSRLGVFFGSMDDHAIRSICLEDDQQDQLNWESDLEELVRSSFLDRAEIAALDKEGNEETLYRYKLHPLMRQYAARKAGDELIARLRPKAAKYFLEYAQHFSNNFNMLELERENILAGMDWAAGHQKSSNGEASKAASNLILKFISALDSYLDIMGYWNEYNHRLQQAIEAAEALEDQKQKAGWIHNQGILSNKKGKYDEARKLYQQSMKIKQELGDKSGIALSRAQLALLEEQIGNAKEALQLILQAEAAFLELGSPYSKLAGEVRQRLEQNQ